MSITYTVTQINNNVDNLLNTNFVNISIEGEVSSANISPSGHVYFTLKDNNSELPCVMFKSAYINSGTQLKPGDYIVSKGSLSIYKPRGQFQFKVFEIKPKGKGDFWENFEKLKIKLAKEGLFDDSRKKEIPSYVKSIMVITSLNGVVKDDIIKIIRSRCSYQKIMLYPVSVQGVTAADEILNAIKDINKNIKTDVIIIARGGGSVEDLWPFNDEQLARGIHESNIPIISAIGHETDFTITDFVSDKRASTPSNAAELVSINQFELLQYIDELRQKIQYLIEKDITYNNETLAELMNKKIMTDPMESHKVIKNNISEIQRLLDIQVGKNLSDFLNVIALLKSNFKNMNPYNVLKRGYAMMLDKNRKAISSIDEMNLGTHVYSILSDGEIKVEVIEKNEKK